MLALGGFFSLHTLHKDFGAEWNFALRHALTVVFLFAWAVVVLGRRAGASSLAAVSVVAITGWLQGMNIQAMYAGVEKDAASGSGRWSAMAWWLGDYRRQHPELVVVTNEAQRLAVLVPDTPMHEVWSATTYDDLETLFTLFSGDLLILRSGQQKSAFGRDRRWPASFDLVLADVSGMDVWRQRPPPDLSVETPP